ncbi:MAG: T9SS type A sorting domain-containing protein [Verrucomicrobia bacterium]|nr:T9SS type A sorting domain-containing protein [Cytophagales bacterium]
MKNFTYFIKNTALNLLIVFGMLLMAPIHLANAQVSSNPTFPTDNASVTIIFDATQGTAGLKDFVGDVYAHTGVITDKSTTASDWKFVKAQWATLDANVKMTRDASNPNIYRLVIANPRTYYGVPVADKMLKLAFIFRNGAGTIEGKGAGASDMFLTLADPNTLAVTFTQPTDSVLVLQANATLNLKTSASKSATITLFDNNTQLAQTLGTALDFTLNFGASGEGEIKVTANDGTTAVQKKITYVIQPPVITQDPPANAKNGINYISATSVLLRLYAPLKNSVYVLGDFNDWKPTASAFMKKSTDGKTFWLQIDNLTAGQEYAFQYVVDNQRVADPYTDKILDPNNDRFIPATTYPNLKPYPAGKTSGIVSVLQTNQTPYNWQVSGFQRPTKEKLVIYELLVRDFLGTRAYKTLSDTLAYLKRLGVNAIELMPITEFAGNDSWGYNPIFYFAPDKAYGTKNDLKAFVDKCHQNGISVILDVVFNQADYEFPYVKMYWEGSKPAANNPMFNQQATHPFSVFFDFNHESQDTRDYMDANLQYWIQEFKMDGFRFDLSKGFTQINSGGNVSAWGNRDNSRIAIWKRIYDKIRTYDNSAYVILEHFADNPEEIELSNYGMLLWGNHNNDYRNLGKGVNSDLSGISYKQRGWTQPNLIGYAESHDEERIMFDVLANGTTNPTYNLKNFQTALERMKMVAAFSVLVPGPKMLWQFQELGYDQSINICRDGTLKQDCRVDAKPVLWNYQQDASRQKLYKVFSEIIKLKTTVPAFSSTDFSSSLNTNAKIIRINHPDMKICVFGNAGVVGSLIQADFQEIGKWYDYFTGIEVEVKKVDEQYFLQAGEFHIYTTAKLAKPETGIVPISWLDFVTASEPEVKTDWKIYPNPSEDKITIQQENTTTDLKVMVRNLQGRTVKETLLKNGQTLDIQSLAEGMYMLEIHSGKAKKIVKIIKK